MKGCRRLEPQKSETQRSKEEAENTRESQVILGESQKIIEREKRKQKKDLQEMKAAVLQKIQDKLTASEEAMKGISMTAPATPSRGNGDSYAGKAARADSRHSDSGIPQHTKEYLCMAKKT